MNNIAGNNRLIADFMELERTESGIYFFTTPIDDYKTDFLMFDSSWDWLMPVVRKIVDYCCNQDDEAFISDYYSSILDVVPLAVIEEAYQVVVDFIKWYNDNDTKNTRNNIQDRVDRVYIDFLNKDKNFQTDRKYFNSYSDAEKWAKNEFEKFHPDMIKYEGGIR